MFDVEIRLSFSFRKMRLNVWFMCVCVNWSWYYMVMYILMSKYLLFQARWSCMNERLLWYLYLCTLTCSSFCLYWDLLNPNELLIWIELNCCLFLCIQPCKNYARSLWWTYYKQNREAINFNGAGPKKLWHGTLSIPVRTILKPRGCINALTATCPSA